MRGELFAGEMGEGAARFGMAHDGIHPAGLQQLVEARRKIPGVGREQRKLAIQRPANSGVHIEMATVDRTRRIGGAIEGLHRLLQRKSPPRLITRGDRQMAAAEQAIQVVVQIATRGADRRQVTKDNQQRLSERLPPLTQIVGQLQQQFRRRGLIAMHARGEDRRLAPRRRRQQLQDPLAQPASLDARREAPLLQAAVH